LFFIPGGASASFSAPARLVDRALRQLDAGWAVHCEARSVLPINFSGPFPFAADGEDYAVLLAAIFHAPAIQIRRGDIAPCRIV
jgi:hypothetical protein